MNRHQQLTALFKAHSPHSALRAGRFEGLLQFQRSAQQWRGDAPVLLLESRYEQMVGDFAGWLRQLLAALPFPPAARRELHASLLADFRDEFTAPDGGHKHALFAGAGQHGAERGKCRQIRFALICFGADFGGFGIDCFDLALILE